MTEAKTVPQNYLPDLLLNGLVPAFKNEQLGGVYDLVIEGGSDGSARATMCLADKKGKPLPDEKKLIVEVKQIPHKVSGKPRDCQQLKLAALIVPERCSIHAASNVQDAFCTFHDPDLNATFVITSMYTHKRDVAQQLFLDEQRRKKEELERQKEAADRVKAEKAELHRQEQEQRKHEEEQRRKAQKAVEIAALLAEAKKLGFDTIEAMDENRRQNELEAKLAVLEIKEKERRAEQVAEDALNAEKARAKAAAKLAQKEAERLEKFGGKRGSPPPSNSSSRNPSASPPPHSGGRVMERRYDMEPSENCDSV